MSDWYGVSGSASVAGFVAAFDAAFIAALDAASCTFGTFAPQVVQQCSARRVTPP
jgi:hypothetical protein